MLKKRFLVTGVVVFAAAFGATACQGSVSIKSALHNTEQVHGAVTGPAALSNSLKIPLTWKGPVNATGTYAPGKVPSDGSSVTFVTTAGNLTVRVISKPKNKQKVLNKSLCRFASVTEVPVEYTGGTQKFTGASGFGVFTLTISGDLPKVGTGCATSNSAVPTNPDIAFAGVGHLKVG